MHRFHFREKHGVRWFCHFEHPHRVSVEFYWWSATCHVSLDVSDEDWTLALAFPPLSIYISLAGLGLWKPQKKHIFTWDNNREAWLTDQREFNLGIYDWTIRLVPWGRSMEWASLDPWWIRGVSFNLRRLLGSQRYTDETLRSGIQVLIPMPEGSYQGTAKVSRQTWKRPLWFARTRVSTWIDIPKGIPFQGKGENSWDCGDDGLYGTGADGDDVEHAIAHVVESVLKSRKRYGQPSAQAIKEALA